MPNNRGWIRLYRQLMDEPEWLAEPFTRGQAWVDLLLLANHETGYIRKRGILIAVDRGQVGFSEDTLAERWRWSRGKVRRFLSELTSVSRISRKISEKTVLRNTSVSSLISILNYDKYQGGSTEDGTEDGTENGPKTVQEQRMKKMKRNTIEEILSKISLLEKRYSSDQKTINQAFHVIAATRKSGRIADTVRLSILQAWDRYPIEKVLSGIKTYLSKDYAGQGKNEKYLLGIIRNSKDEGQNQAIRSTGSALLDKYYREREASNESD